MDASNRALKAVLSQVSADGSEHLVGYICKKKLPWEERYSTTEKECLAIKLGLEHACG